jgi:hypothetical protein
MTWGVFYNLENNFSPYDQGALAVATAAKFQAGGFQQVQSNT